MLRVAISAATAVIQSASDPILIDGQRRAFRDAAFLFQDSSPSGFQRPAADSKNSAACGRFQDSSGLLPIPRIPAACCRFQVSSGLRPIPRIPAACGRFQDSGGLRPILRFQRPAADSKIPAACGRFQEFQRPAADSKNSAACDRFQDSSGLRPIPSFWGFNIAGAFRSVHRTLI